MATEILENWLLNINKKFGKQKQYIVLLRWQLYGLHSMPKLKNVKISFFAANVTFVIQPIDLVIVKKLKHFLQAKWLLVERIFIGCWLKESFDS